MTVEELRALAEHVLADKDGDNCVACSEMPETLPDDDGFHGLPLARAVLAALKFRFCDGICFHAEHNTTREIQGAILEAAAGEEP